MPLKPCSAGCGGRETRGERQVAARSRGIVTKYRKKPLVCHSRGAGQRWDAPDRPMLRASAADLGPEAVQHQLEAVLEVGRLPEGAVDGPGAVRLHCGLLLHGVPEEIGRAHV